MSFSSLHQAQPENRCARFLQALPENRDARYNSLWLSALARQSLLSITANTFSA
jgi:hypothetical protein